MAIGNHVGSVPLVGTAVDSTVDGENVEEDKEESTEGMDESVRERARKNHRLIADFSSSLRSQGYRA